MDLTAAEPVSPAVRALCDGFNGFGLDLHRGLPPGVNTFISPLSIGAALATLIPGARGEATALMAFGLGIMEEEVPLPIPFVVDRPFYFFIRGRLTGVVLFMGRVMDPAA